MITASAPKHLSAEAKRIWKDILQEYAIDDSAGLRILQAACEAYDRAQTAREKIKVEGMTHIDRWGQTKPHVLLPIERDSRAAFLAALKQLNLDLEPLKAIGRPPGGR